MISERTFLMKVFAREDATKEMREMIIKRCEELDNAMDYAPPTPRAVFPTNNPDIGRQSPSMQRIMANNPDLIPQAPVAPVPVSPAAAQALAARQALISGAMNERPEPGRTSKRKI